MQNPYKVIQEKRQEKGGKESEDERGVKEKTKGERKYRKGRSRRRKKGD